MNDIETAKRKLASIVPHLLRAAELAKSKAKEGARVEFAIIAKNEDGSGQVGASFECSEFLADLEKVFPPSEEDRADARAASIFGGFIR